MKLRVFFALILGLMLSSFVSATLETSLDQLATDSEPILRFLLGDVTGVSGFDASEILFVKLLVFILIVAIVNVALGQFPSQLSENKKLTLLIAVIVGLLSVRYLVEGELVSLIWLPYGVLGVALSSLLPLIIMFFFLQSFESSFIRKTGWALFGVIFLVLGYLRWDTFSTTSEAFGFNLAWIYIVTGIISWIMYMFDKEIYSQVDFARINAMTDVHKRNAASNLGVEIQTLQNELGSVLDASSRRVKERLIKEKKKTLHALMRS